MIKDEIIRLENRWAELLKGPNRLNEPKASNIKITAAELQEQLLQDQEYQKWLKEKEQVRTALEAAYAEDEKPLVEDLQKAGLNITSSWDFVNTKSSYKPAIPILLEHLSKPYHLKNKEGIVRALAVKEAIGKASPVLIAEYNRTPKDKMLLRWAIGNTIYTTITEDDVESILPIILNKTNGPSRQMFVAALGKVKSGKTEDVLINLLDDEEVTPHALEALGRMKSSKAREKITLLTNHPKALIRREALKALKKVS
jgi:HEAT repeat protein